eukprot:3676469-Ditylum_brightwellii.AAC.1
MDNVMKKQIQDAIEDVYIWQLHHKYSIYLGVTARDVLDYLINWYRQIKPADLVANGENFNKPMDISQLIDAYFAHTDGCIQYMSDSKTPYTLSLIHI